ncbi:hypothetical protein Hanom_Chr11g01007691 [Helianthus anomalus]
MELILREGFFAIYNFSILKRTTYGDSMHTCIKKTIDTFRGNIYLRSGIGIPYAFI